MNNAIFPSTQCLNARIILLANFIVYFIKMPLVRNDKSLLYFDFSPISALCMVQK